MEKPINDIFEQYKWNFWVEVDSLVQQRAQNYTQTEMAHKLGVSLRKIQHFERFKCLDGFLIFGYQTILDK
jgi:hypothetical protein